MRHTVLAVIGFTLLGGLGESEGTAGTPEATVMAPGNCTIRCTLESSTYSWFSSERCLNALNAEQREKLQHECVVKLEQNRKRPERSRSELQRHCKGDVASASSPESAEHFRNCANPLTTDEYHREMQRWLEQNEKYEGRSISDAEASRQVKAMQRILARERQRQAEIKRRETRP